MGILSQIVEFARILVPDLIWLSLLTPTSLSVIRLQQAIGLAAPMKSSRTFEMSLLLAYLISIAIRLLILCVAPSPPDSTNPRRSRSSVSKGPVHDAAE